MRVWRDSLTRGASHGWLGYWSTVGVGSSGGSKMLNLKI